MGDNLSKCPVCGADEDYLSSNGALMRFKCGSRYFYKWPEYPESLCTNIVRDFIAQRATIAALLGERSVLLTNLKAMVDVYGDYTPEAVLIDARAVIRECSNKGEG